MRPAVDLSAPSPTMACPIAFAATMGRRLRAPGSRACRVSRCGGCGSASSPSGLPWGTRSKTGRTSNFIRSSKPTRRGPPPSTRGPNNVAFSDSVPNTTTIGLTKRSHDDVPASVYRASPRPLPSRLPALEYPGHFEIRRVSPIGQVSWRGHLHFVSGALAGEEVAFEEVDDGLWTLHFAQVTLARLDERHPQIQPIAPFKGGRSASSAGSAAVMKNKKSP